MKKIFFIVIISFYVAGSAMGEKPKQQPHICSSSIDIQDAQLKYQTLTFIENKGQITDQYHNERSDIQFKMTVDECLSIFIGSGFIHYQFSQANIENANLNPFGSEHDCNHAFRKHQARCPHCNMYRLDAELVGANTHAKVIVEQQQGYYERRGTMENYDQTEHAFNKIVYKNIYPHIDWVLCVNNGKLSQEFVVRKGGRVADIQLKYGGSMQLILNTDGSVSAITPQGTVSEQAPISCLADGKAVSSRFRLHGDLVTYEVAAYSGTLIIDPALAWATYYGGSGVEHGSAAATDRSGNVYITGYTNSFSDIATTGAYQVSYFGGTDYGDAYLAKFSGEGVLEWATYFGGTGDDIGTGLATDTAGNVYMTGITNSTSRIATSGAYQDTLGGGVSDAFIAKFNSAGGIQWATYYGGSGQDQGYGAATDDSGNVYLIGGTNSVSNIASPGAYQAHEADGGTEGDAFLVKFNSAGTRIWATYYGGNGTDGASGVATDDSGNVYFTGETNSVSGIATPGAYLTTLDGGLGTYDAFLAKFSGTGNILWATYYGGNQDDFGNGVATDQSHNVYITGQTSSNSGIATPGAYQTAFGGGTYDAFLAKFNVAGAIQWATYYGGNGDDLGQGVVTNGSASVYVTGYTSSSSGIATPNAYQVVYGGATDAFLAMFDSVADSVQWATYYGGIGEDYGYGIAADESGNVFITGQTASASGIATHGAYDTSYAGGKDAFIAKFNSSSITGTNTISIPTNGIIVYPNPATNSISIKSQVTINNVAICNSIGEKVFYGAYTTKNVTISLSELPAGSYILRINNGATTTISKQ